MIVNLLFTVAGFAAGASIVWLLMSWPDHDPWETDQAGWDDYARALSDDDEDDQ